MNKKAGLSLFCLLSLSAQISSAANCVRIMQDVVAELADKKETDTLPVAGAPSASTDDAGLDAALGAETAANSSTLALKQGQIMASPGPDATGQFTRLILDRKTYHVPLNMAKSVKLKNCFVQPICLIVKGESVALKNVDDPSGAKVPIRRGERYATIATKTNAANERTFLINAQNDYFWVNSKNVATYTNKTCEEIKDLAVTEVVEQMVQSTQGRNSKYAFGLEFGTGSGYKSDVYSPFITEVPDASNVGSLSNPVVTEVKKGSGFFVGPLLEIKFSEAFKLKLGTQYQENKFKYVGKENPTIAPNTLDSLPDTEGEIKNQSVVFSVAPAYEFGGTNHRLGLGVNLRMHYYISKPSTISYRVGTVFKGNELIIEAGPKGFESSALLSLYYQWYPGETSPFALRATIESDGSVMNMGLSAFY